MPVTPFHFGPGAALHAIAPRHVSFLAFCTANVVIDVESLYNLVARRYPVHAFLHTYVGATVATALTVLLFAVARVVASRVRLPDLFAWQELTVVQVVVGAALGAYSHIVLDGVMHRDITPLAPFDRSNALLGIVSLGTLHWFCVGCALVGLALTGVRAVVRAHEKAL